MSVEKSCVIESRTSNSLARKMAVMRAYLYAQRRNDAKPFPSKAWHESKSHKPSSLMFSSIGGCSVKLGNPSELNWKIIVASPSVSDSASANKYLSTGDKIEQQLSLNSKRSVLVAKPFVPEEKIFLTLHDFRKIAKKSLSTDLLKKIVLDLDNDSSKFTDSVIDLLIESVTERISDKYSELKIHYYFLAKDKDRNEFISAQSLNNLLNMSQDRLKNCIEKKLLPTEYQIRLVELLLRVYQLLNHSSEYVKAWVSDTPNSDLGNITPFQLLVTGKIEEVESLIYAIEMGQAS
jgi:hypothetical protein